MSRRPKQIGLVEKWEVIPYTNEVYSVSNLGFVRSNSRNGKGRLLKVYHPKFGYPVVHFYINNRYTTHPVAKLVADAFCENKYEFKEVCYRDGNPSNCRADNLYWGKGDELTEEKVAQILLIYSINHKIRKEVVAEAFKTSVSEVEAIIYRRKWSYVEVPKPTGNEHFKRFYLADKGINKFDIRKRK